VDLRGQSAAQRAGRDAQDQGAAGAGRCKAYAPNGSTKPLSGVFVASENLLLEVMDKVTGLFAELKA
jgi:hypothetical protein